jgi:superoxide reductase
MASFIETFIPVKNHLTQNFNLLLMRNFYTCRKIVKIIKGNSMQRRNFIGLSLAGVGVSFLAPGIVEAKKPSQLMAGGVFYTKQNPGRWSKKIASHLPNIEIERSNGIVKVQVVTAHGMDGYKHYIVKHVLLDQDYNFLDEKMFDPMNDEAPISTFTLKNYSGRIYALSMCNKHDVWLSSAKT